MDFKNYIDNLIKYNGSDAKPTFGSMLDIVDNLSNFFREVYGKNIDLTKGTADAQYIMGLALIINNIFATMDNMYKQLLPESATGGYLDALCSFSNIKRKMQTYSTCLVYICKSTITTYDTTTNNIKQIRCSDNFGNVWYANLDSSFEITDEKKTITLTCMAAGPIDPIPATPVYIDGITSNGIDWDNQPFGSIKSDSDEYSIYQIDYANVGQYAETDDKLKSRRLEESSGNSVNVLEGLKGALFDVQGIKDVFVWDYSALSDRPSWIPTQEGLICCVYVCLRFNKNMDVEDENIGEIIYNKLTPGVSTFVENDDTWHTYDKIKVIGENTYIAKYNWQVATPVSPSISLSFVYNVNTYVKGNQVGSEYSYSETENRIITNIKNLMYDVKLGNTITIASIMNSVASADIAVGNTPTFFVTGGNINGNTTYNTANHYFDYSNANFTFSYNDSTGVCTLSVGA